MKINITVNKSVLLSGRDESKQRKTAHARIKGPDSLNPKSERLETSASISWTSNSENAEKPCLMHTTKCKLALGTQLHISIGKKHV